MSKATCRQLLCYNMGELIGVRINNEFKSQRDVLSFLIFTSTPERYNKLVERKKRSFSNIDRTSGEISVNIHL